LIFSLMEVLHPGSFATASGQPGELLLADHMLIPEFVYYYSLVTLTTLGYGDIKPVTPLAQAFAALEAVMGQLYLAVLIARLVGLLATRPPEVRDAANSAGEDNVRKGRDKDVQWMTLALPALRQIHDL
jgi:hypothetical protein